MTLSKKTLIQSAYRAILHREPDPRGLAHYSAKLGNGFNAADLITELKGSAEAIGARDNSQNGEFSIFLGYARPSRGGIVVDVGAKQKQGSNSYDLMAQYGWRGLLIEANPDNIPVIEREFSGLNYELHQAVVSNVDGPATFYLSFMSSLLPEMAAHYGTTNAVQVTTQRLGPILAEHSIPKDFDLLSLDIEGVDVPVMIDLLASGYRPRWVWIEARSIPPEIERRYQIVARTHPNLLLKLRCDSGAT